jgi:hypothetical protein
MTLIADREYIGREWFGWLKQEMKLDWVIRIPIRDKPILPLKPT